MTKTAYVTILDGSNLIKPPFLKLKTFQSSFFSSFDGYIPVFMPKTSHFSRRPPCSPRRRPSAAPVLADLQRPGAADAHGDPAESSLVEWKRVGRSAGNGG